MKSKLGRALACATLAAALVGAAVWLPGASADQPAPRQTEFVSDTFGGATRSIVTGECVRTSLPEAGAVVPGCGAPAETAKAPAPPPPEPKVVANPQSLEPTPAPPAEPIALEEPRNTPATSADAEVAAAEAHAGASADSNFDEAIAAAEEAMEPEAEAAAATVPAPEPPASVAEDPAAPAAPQVPPETGMAPPTPPVQPRKLRLAADTQFHFDRAQLTPAGTAELDKLIAEMGAAQIGAVTIVGYTDRIGPDAYNQKLSERRAETVKQYLVGRSVEADRMQAIGRGKSDPVTAPDGCKGLRGQRLIKCLAPDRRVEIEVVGLLTPAR